MLPSPLRGVLHGVLGGCLLGAVATLQSGSALTIADTNSKNVFGISQDRAQLSGTCSKRQLVRSASIESKLSSYFNATCFSSPPVMGADGIRTAFGNSATGIVDGPGQANLELALSMTVVLRWPAEQKRAAFSSEPSSSMRNHAQFANPTQVSHRPRSALSVARLLTLGLDN
jgi:hypothetical protein